MKTLKSKLILIILTLVAVSSVLTLTFGLIESFGVTENIVNTLISDRLTSANNMLKSYLSEEFGTFSLNSNGALVDKTGKAIDGQYTYIDKFSQDMAVVATVFAKQGEQYVRIITTVTDEKGARAVGTELDKTGKAYQAIENGQDFLGQATILGSQYMTGYSPMLDENKQVIGIYFVGVPMQEANAILQEGKLSTIKGVLFLVGIVLIIAAVATLFISNGISRPIKQVTNAARQMADGDFAVQLSVQSKDEVGQLANAFHLTIERLVNYQAYIDEISGALEKVSHGDLQIALHMDYTGQFEKLKHNMQALLDNLNTTMLKINQASVEVHSGAEEVSNASQALSGGAVQQASAVQELSASIVEITQRVQQNAENANAAYRSAEASGSEIHKSDSQMQEMVAAMQQISLKTAEISKINKIIEDIAFQTNILALNAAVEAARAGTAGKGFAVVADEVRNLAGKSAEAAKNTTLLIEETVKTVESGALIAEKTAGSLNESTRVIQKTVTLIDEIAKASSVQANAIAQIKQGVEQISSVVQTNAATAEESAASSEELSEQSSILQTLIAQFNLR